ncbi:MAG: PLP-dependent transferase [Lachnospiraceae bacterium]|nr:PLP-dependent transferase [Lachnospiraceae bacterium]
MEKKKRADLLDRLTEYCGGESYPFHMPGHKRNPGSLSLSEDVSEHAPGTATDRLACLYGIDITEISGFDDLNHASGILKEAEERAAKAYGSEETHFLVNGSTAGILAAISTVAVNRASGPVADGLRVDHEGKEESAGQRHPVLLIARNCHRSVYHAAILNRLDLRYVLPEYDTAFGIPGRITPEAVEEALKDSIAKNDRIVGVLITSPTYEGIISDIRVISKLTHAYGLPLIVDEAHGAHFGFAKGFPENAVRLGADLVIHSAHKTLPAPTQTALIHVNGERINRGILRKFLRIYQTSSPSYPLMAGLDRAVETAAFPDYPGFSKILRSRSRIESEISDLNRIKICKYNEPGKLLFRVEPGTGRKGRPFSGRELFECLRDRYRIEMEMASGQCVLGILTGSDTEEGVKRLILALSGIDRELEEGPDEHGGPDKETPGGPDKETPGEPGHGCPALSGFRLPETVIPLYEAFALPETFVPVEDASGRIAGDFLFPYPPGVPMAVPGERIPEKLVSELIPLLDAGYDIRGIEEGKVAVLLRQ